MGYAFRLPLNLFTGLSVPRDQTHPGFPESHCYTGWMFWLQDFEQLRQREVNEREIESEERSAEVNQVEASK